MEPEAVPDVILNPPATYPRIVNQRSVCDIHPTLKYNGSIQDTRVASVVSILRDALDDAGIDTYVEEYSTVDDEQPQAELRDAVEQALAFYEDHEEEFDELDAYYDARGDTE
jgi:hypothetical protein